MRGREICSIRRICRNIRGGGGVVDHREEARAAVNEAEREQGEMRMMFSFLS